MNIVACQFCRKPFASVSGKICPDCVQQIEKDFITVKDYIYDHARAGIDEISEETEVSKKIIMYLLKEGRLIIDGPSGGVLDCEVCKKPINTGRLCADCAKKISSSIDPKGSDEEGKKSGPAERNWKASAKIR